MIAFDLHSFGRLHDRHGCRAGQQLHHHAFVRWIEVLYQDERHAAIDWQRGQEFPACTQTTRRGTDPDDWEISATRRRPADKGTPGRPLWRRFGPIRLAIWHDRFLSGVPGGP
jgi:hypothetical protein